MATKMEQAKRQRPSFMERLLSLKPEHMTEDQYFRNLGVTPERLAEWKATDDPYVGEVVEMAWRLNTYPWWLAGDEVPPGERTWRDTETAWIVALCRELEQNGVPRGSALRSA